VRFALALSGLFKRKSIPGHGKRKISKLRRFSNGVSKKDPTPKPVKLEQIIEKQIKKDILTVKKESESWRKSTISE
jgi:hypothetical protein